MQMVQYTKMRMLENKVLQEQQKLNKHGRHGGASCPKLAMKEILTLGAIHSEELKTLLRLFSLFAELMYEANLLLKPVT